MTCLFDLKPKQNNLVSDLFDYYNSRGYLKRNTWSKSQYTRALQYIFISAKAMDDWQNVIHWITFYKTSLLPTKPHHVWPQTFPLSLVPCTPHCYHFKHARNRWRPLQQETLPETLTGALPICHIAPLRSLVVAIPPTGAAVIVYGLNCTTAILLGFLYGNNVNSFLFVSTWHFLEAPSCSFCLVNPGNDQEDSVFWDFWGKKGEKIESHTV